MIVAAVVLSLAILVESVAAAIVIVSERRSVQSIKVGRRVEVELARSGQASPPFLDETAEQCSAKHPYPPRTGHCARNTALE